MNQLGNRIKRNYEDRYRFYLTRRTPVIVRIDGNHFHSLCRDMEKPFDKDFIYSMVWAARELLKESAGGKVAYTQSDEISLLLTDYDTLNTEAWFDYNKSKLESICASIVTARFNQIMRSLGKDKIGWFDARAFNVPKEEVANYFLWRAKDWERNSVNMLCGHYYSHKEMYGKNKSDKHEMMYQKGVNWGDLDDQLKNGTFITRYTQCFIKPEYESIANLVEEFL